MLPESENCPLQFLSRLFCSDGQTRWKAIKRDSRENASRRSDKITIMKASSSYEVRSTVLSTFLLVFFLHLLKLIASMKSAAAEAKIA